MISFGYLSRAKKKALAEGNLIVLCFHNPGKRLFEKIILWLKKNGFTIVNTSDVVEYYTRRKPIPAGAVWITLDDGWRGNVGNVLPVLQSQKVHAAIFVCSGAVETDGVYWWTYAVMFRRSLPEKFRQDIKLLWKIPEAERKKVLGELAADIKKEIPRQAFTVDELKQISSSEFVTIGSHTVNHVITPNCTDDELIYELDRSKHSLEEWTGRKVNIFAYPNADHNGREEAFLEKTGYELAVIGGNKFADISSSSYRIPRMIMGESSYYEDLLHIFGVWQKFIGKVK